VHIFFYIVAIAIGSNKDSLLLLNELLNNLNLKREFFSIIDNLHEGLISKTDKSIRLFNPFAHKILIECTLDLPKTSETKKMLEKMFD